MFPILFHLYPLLEHNLQGDTKAIVTIFLHGHTQLTYVQGREFEQNVQGNTLLYTRGS